MDHTFYSTYSSFVNRSGSSSFSDQQYMITKGAIDKMLDKTTLIDCDNKVRKITKSDIDAIKKANERFSSEGKRVLCFGYKNVSKSSIDKNDEKDFIFIGLIDRKSVV